MWEIFSGMRKSWSHGKSHVILYPHKLCHDEYIINTVGVEIMVVISTLVIVN